MSGYPVLQLWKRVFAGVRRRYATRWEDAPEWAVGEWTNLKLYQWAYKSHIFQFTRKHRQLTPRHPTPHLFVVDSQQYSVTRSTWFAVRFLAQLRERLWFTHFFILKRNTSSNYPTHTHRVSRNITCLSNLVMLFIFLLRKDLKSLFYIFYKWEVNRKSFLSSRSIFFIQHQYNNSLFSHMPWVLISSSLVWQFTVSKYLQ